MIYVIYYSAEYEDQYTHGYVESEEEAQRLVEHLNSEDNMIPWEDDFKWNYYYREVKKLKGPEVMT